MDITLIIEKYYALWVISAVIIGITFPGIRIFSNYSSLLLAIMIGSISLTITPNDLINQDFKSIATILLFHSTMPILGFILGLMFNLPNMLLAGMVIIGAVTPEFVTPVVTHLSKGDTSLSSSVLLITGLGSIITIPFFASFLIQSSIELNLTKLVKDLILIIMIPMTIGISLKSQPLQTPLYLSTYFFKIFPVFQI